MWFKTLSAAVIFSILAVQGCNSNNTSKATANSSPEASATAPAASTPSQPPVEVGQEEKVVVSVGADKFEQLIEQWAEEGAVIDVRTPEEYVQGHLPHAININIYDENFKEQVLRKVGERPVVLVYCRSGRRSLKAAGILKEMGYPKIYNLRGGILEWMESGRPVLE